MTEQSGPLNGPQSEARNGARQDYRPMARAREGRLVAGVCTGLGRYTGIDPVVFRVGFVVLLIAGGQGLLLYVAAALVMPKNPEAAAPAERVLRRRFDGGAALTILAGLLAVCVLFSVTGSGLVGAGMSGNALSVVVVFALVLLTAHARNVDMVQVARTLPERLQGHPLDRPPAAAAFEAPAPAAEGRPLPEGMIDLATLAPPQQAQPARPAEPAQPAQEARQARQARRPARPRSVLTPITLLVALIAASAVLPVAAPYGGSAGWQIVPAAALAAVGLGLVAGGWFGRARGLATVGTILTFSLVTSTAVAEAPRDARFGDVEWRPTDVTGTEQSFRVFAGSGKLDLTALPLAPGQRVAVRAEITLGELTVTLPRGARVDLDAKASVGDLTVEGRLTGGPNAKVNEVLAPEPAPAKGAAQNPPVIDLRLRSKFGDVDVRRG